jgi:hypothetical protein
VRAEVELTPRARSIASSGDLPRPSLERGLAVDLGQGLGRVDRLLEAAELVDQAQLQGLDAGPHTARAISRTRSGGSLRPSATRATKPS